MMCGSANHRVRKDPTAAAASRAATQWCGKAELCLFVGLPYVLTRSSIISQ